MYGKKSRAKNVGGNQNTNRNTAPQNQKTVVINHIGQEPPPGTASNYGGPPPPPGAPPGYGRKKREVEASDNKNQSE